MFLLRSKNKHILSELSAFVGRNLLIVPMDASKNVIKMNKLAGIAEMVITLKEFNNSDNLEDGKPSNVLLRHHMTSSEEFTNYEPVIPQYKELKKCGAHFHNPDNNGPKEKHHD